jgi:hypothetical protein
MELILHVSISFEKWSATTVETKESGNQKKLYIQGKLQEELGLNIDKAKQSTGNTRRQHCKKVFPQLSEHPRCE